MGEKIFNALTAVSVDVIALHSPKQTAEQFSVRTKEEVQFVHLFKSGANCTAYIKCCSSICQTRFNKKVRAIHILDATVWDDLKKFIEYIDANSKIYDESDGDLDQKSSAFYIDDEEDQDNEISDSESIQVWAVCVGSIVTLLLLVLLSLPSLLLSLLFLSLEINQVSCIKWFKLAIFFPAFKFGGHLDFLIVWLVNS